MFVQLSVKMDVRMVDVVSDLTANTVFMDSLVHSVKEVRRKENLPLEQSAAAAARSHIGHVYLIVNMCNIFITQ